MAADAGGAAARAEFAEKLALVRAGLASGHLAAVRLRGSDWFAWLSCGGSSVVDSSSEEGVAEVLVTPSDVVVLADRIDAARLRQEELAPRVPDLPVVELPWADTGARETAARQYLDGGSRVASDRPRPGEQPLPAELVDARLRLTQPEIERFRSVGADAAQALSTALRSARPELTESELAALTAAALIDRTLWPVVILVGGARRLPLYRHPVPRPGEAIGEHAMVVACARRDGLVANLTRFVYFRSPGAADWAAHRAVARVEAAAFDASASGPTLGDVYRVMRAAYAREGFAGAEADHHQGGLAGYRTREEIARPDSKTHIRTGSALAWSPSLPGVKIEDTVVVTATGIDVLTVDPEWPSVMVGGRRRPDILVLA